MCVPRHKFLQARPGVSTGGQTNPGLNEPLERLLRSTSGRQRLPGPPPIPESPSGEQCPPEALVLGVPRPGGHSVLREPPWNLFPEDSVLRELLSRRPLNAKKRGASCLVCSAGRGLGLNLCVLRETPPGGPGEIQALGRTFAGRTMSEALLLSLVFVLPLSPLVARRRASMFGYVRP